VHPRAGRPEPRHARSGECEQPALRDHSGARHELRLLEALDDERRGERRHGGDESRVVGGDDDPLLAQPTVHGGERLRGLDHDGITQLRRCLSRVLEARAATACRGREPRTGGRLEQRQLVHAPAHGLT
jgi:hypothetical protein